MHKVTLRPTERDRLHVAKLIDEVVLQAFVRVLLDLVQRNGVDDRLDQPRIVRQTDDPVRLHPEANLFLLPDQLEHLQGRAWLSVKAGSI